MKQIIAILFCLVLVPAQARMYQWSDPETGTTQFSGKPPAWYRSQLQGPRVFVFERGKLVDDTGVRVSDEHRELLRQQAFIKAEEDIEMAKQKAIAARKQKPTGIDEEASEAVEVEDEEIIAGVMDKPVARTPAEFEETEVEKPKVSLEDMKQLIQEWETLQEQAAKAILDN